jgi:exonuclease SbcD
MAARLLHVSDTHLGKRQYGADVRRDDFAAAFEAAIDVAIAEDVDAVVHTGDLFDSRSPALPDVTRCIDALQRLDDAGIRFLGIVGNHDRKLEEQWLDLMGQAAQATRLGREPTVIGGVALYGIDAVPAPAWDGADFSLAPPPGEETTICCMHQLLTPPVPPIQAEYETADVLDRFDCDLDGLALGDYHEAEGAIVDDTQVWYAGSTERCSAGEVAPRSVALLTVDDDIDIERIELDTRPFERIEIEFGPDDGIGHVESVVGQHGIEECVVPVTLAGERTTVSASDVRATVLDRGAAVCRVDDDRGRDDLEAATEAAGDVPDRETVINQRLADADLDPFVLGLEETVRAATATAGLDETIEERVAERAELNPAERGADRPATDPNDSAAAAAAERDEASTGRVVAGAAEDTEVDTGDESDSESDEEAADTAGEADTEVEDAAPDADGEPGAGSDDDTDIDTEDESATEAEDEPDADGEDESAIESEDQPEPTTEDDSPAGSTGDADDGATATLAQFGGSDAD